MPQGPTHRISVDETLVYGGDGKAALRLFCSATARFLISSVRGVDETGKATIEPSDIREGTRTRRQAAVFQEGRLTNSLTTLGEEPL